MEAGVLKSHCSSEFEIRKPYHWICNPVSTFQFNFKSWKYGLRIFCKRSGRYTGRWNIWPKKRSMAFEYNLVKSVTEPGIGLRNCKFRRASSELQISKSEVGRAVLFKYSFIKKFFHFIKVLLWLFTDIDFLIKFFLIVGIWIINSSYRNDFFKVWMKKISHLVA